MAGGAGGFIGGFNPLDQSPIKYSGVWDLKDQVQAIAAGRWTGIPLYELYAWGLNNQGQLALNDSVNRSSPVQVGALTNWSQVSSTSNSSGGVKVDGTLWTWGSNTTNGQLGLNDTINRSSPVQVGSLTNWYQVSCGGTLMGAVKTNGTLWAWGKGNRGGVGNNSTLYRSSPVQIGALTTWSQVSMAGDRGSAIKTDGTLWVWGSALRGGLGINDSTSAGYRSSPVQVGSLTDWYQVSFDAGQVSMAIKTNNTLWAWGYNNEGQLALNDRVNRSSPVQVGALSDWSYVSCGGQSNVAVKTNGTLWTWGRNNVGQLGDNTVVNRSSPVQVGALTDWAKVSASGDHVSAIKTNGTLWVFGNGASGQLASNDRVNRSSPVQVGNLTNWYQSSSGGSFTTSIILKTTN